MVNTYVLHLTNQETTGSYPRPPKSNFKHSHILSNFLAILANKNFNHTWDGLLPPVGLLAPTRSIIYSVRNKLMEDNTSQP